MDHKHPDRNPSLLIFSVSGFILIAAFINIYPPDALWKIIVFICGSVASVGLLLQYLFRDVGQTLLLSTGLLVFLVLRAYGLHSPVYAALLLASILALEFSMRRS